MFTRVRKLHVVLLLTQQFTDIDRSSINYELHQTALNNGGIAEGTMVCYRRLVLGVTVCFVALGVSWKTVVQHLSWVVWVVDSTLLAEATETLHQ